jgi:hypothetical protein
VWSNGNAAHGVQGMPHLSIYRGVVNGWDHVIRCHGRPVRVAFVLPQPPGEVNGNTDVRTVRCDGRTEEVAVVGTGWWGWGRGWW